jgi:hypothetical protein
VSALRTDCPRCGRAMILPLPPDVDAADLARIARLVLCDSCANPPEPKPVKPAEPLRLPYRDD